MNSQQVPQAPRVMKESKNKIRVEFERTPLKERLKAKFINMNFLKNVVFKIFRFVLLVGISYVVLFPYISKIFGSFMSREDFVDVSVLLIPKYPTLDTYKAIINDNKYVEALLNTATISVLCGVIQMLICAVVGYGFAKFNFKGKGILFLFNMEGNIEASEKIRIDAVGIIEIRYVFGDVLVDRGYDERGIRQQGDG